MARKKRTVGFGELAASAVRRADPEGKRHGARAIAAWRDVVGEDISRRTHGFALRPQGELVVYVDSAAWAHQLSLMSGDLLERLSAHLGENLVRSLRFTVSRKVKCETEWEENNRVADMFYAPDPVVPVALTEIETLQATEIALAIHDPHLREVALRVMIKDLELKKGARQRPPGGA